MNKLLLFVDGSANTISKVGYGAYLLVSEPILLEDNLNKCVKVKRFDKTSSTKLEIQTLLWALKDIKPSGGKLNIYTDSQNIVGLPARRERFEKNNYFSKNGKRIGSFELYREFYNTIELIHCEIIKVKGHKKSNQKENIDQLFTIVDRASRKALREDNK